MLVRIYWSLWIVLALAAIFAFALGTFTTLTAVVFGFFAFGLTFMGMMGVLPAMVTNAHTAPPKVIIMDKKVSLPKARETSSSAFGTLKSA